MPDSRISSWNTFNILETTPGINAIGLNEKENSWKPSDTGKLISLLGIPSIESKISRGEDLEDLLDKLFRNVYESTSILRFGPDRERDPIIKPLSERIPILLTFPT